MNSISKVMHSLSEMHLSKVPYHERPSVSKGKLHLKGYCRPPKNRFLTVRIYIISVSIRIECYISFVDETFLREIKRISSWSICTLPAAVRRTIQWNCSDIKLKAHFSDMRSFIIVYNNTSELFHGAEFV